MELFPANKPGKPKQPRVRCTLCEDLTLAYSGGTVHQLETKHPLSLKHNSIGDGKNQQTLTTFKPCSSERSSDITMAIASFVATDLRPIAVVDGYGFKALMKMVEPYKCLYPTHTNGNSTQTPSSGYHCTHLKPSLIGLNLFLLSHHQRKIGRLFREWDHLQAEATFDHLSSATNKYTCARLLAVCFKLYPSLH